MQPGELMLFALQSSREIGAEISRLMVTPLNRHEEREFEDGEHKSRPLTGVRGRDVFVIQSLYADQSASVNDKLCRLLFFIGALRDASAARVTAIVPYLCYSRKDRKTKSRDPVTTRYVAQVFEAVGTDRVVTMDVHNLAAFQNAFRIRTDHVEAQSLFANYFAALVREVPVTVVSPDAGGIKRVRAFRDVLARVANAPVETAFMEKGRSEGIVSGQAFVGNVANRTVIILDDLICSGTTLIRAAKVCRANGAQKVFAAATHGVFAANAEQILADAVLENIVVTNTIPPFRLSQQFIQQKLTVLDVAPVFAEVIQQIHAPELLPESGLLE